MSRASRQLDADRAARNRVRRRFNTRFGQAREDLAPGAVAARLAGELKRQGRDTLDEAVEIAGENRTIVAGTIAALAIWFLRKPIVSWLGSKLGGDGNEEDVVDDGI